MHTLRSPRKVLLRHRSYFGNDKDNRKEFYTLHSEDQLPLCPTRGYNVEVGEDETVETPCVYTLKTGTWCAISSPTPSVGVVLSKACFVNGSLHWVVEDSDAIVDLFYILTFDLSTHVFGRIALPETSWTRLELTTIKAFLALINTKRDDADCWIWVRRDDSWCKFDFLELIDLLRATSSTGANLMSSYVH
ncbi:hypothetical protein L1887_02926 [Cichorium endivia]|nr:hypothetical protein L1887_02926 [Cichorium endivia]